MNPASLVRRTEFEWEIPRAGAMRVPGIIFASQELVAAMDEKVREQVVNVAGLPGIVVASYAMPDAHWGYGFPIGGVAAFDAEDGGVVSAVLLGSSPEQGINAQFWQLKHELNDNPDVHLEIGYDEELAHLIYAGADMLIVPSLFEPCGLTQMIALRYGTVPVVRWVGGLADTVFDRDYSERPVRERNGYVFHQADNSGIESAMDRAIGLWFDYPDEFRQLADNAMHYDYSWNRPGTDYLNIYEYIRHK